ncbi:MAG: short-subunit dehydrogenase [Sulfitobacter sp.]|jgi:short-subunit dehydrogenase
MEKVAPIMTSKGTALITGASSGIGEELARHFARQNFDLVITARRESNLNALAEELRGKVSVTVVSCDLAERAGVDALLDAVAEIDIDVLVNNAGIAYSGSFSSQEDDKIQNLINLNIVAVTRLTHHLLPKMINRGMGRIMNVASVASFQPVPSLAAYAASKAYVLSLTESLSEELRGTGVSVTALCPGLTKTPLLDEVQGFDVPAGIASTPADVAREGYDALMNREVIRVPGIANQAALAWAKHQPRWLVRGLGGLVARFNPNNR